ncbi:hypothetical protein [Micromonospora sp. NPDC049900]|uniref:hypothetical protein n=1 Tax=unclassified Micromonospora TaxID=2617518 RepID=UPI00378C8D1E
MSAASDDQPGPTRPGLWRLVGAAALACLGVIVLWSTFRQPEPPDGSSRALDQFPSQAPVDPPIEPPTLSPLGAEDEPVPSGTPEGTPSVAVSGPAAPSPGRTSARPVPSTTTPGTSILPTSAAVTPSRTPSRSPAAQFRPVTVQAEASGNLRSGGAAVAYCDPCDGGARIRYLGQLTVYLDVAVAGSRTVTVGYTVDGTRELKVVVNGGAPQTFTVTGSSWETPRSFRFTASIPAGRTAVTFYNDSGPPPDIDKVTVS